MAIPKRLGTMNDRLTHYALAARNEKFREDSNERLRSLRDEARLRQAQRIHAETGGHFGFEVDPGPRRKVVRHRKRVGGSSKK